MKLQIWVIFVFLTKKQLIFAAESELKTGNPVEKMEPKLFLNWVYICHGFSPAT